MNMFFKSNKALFRFLRTVAQAIVGFLFDNIAMIVAQTTFNATTQAIIVSGNMAVLSVIMKYIGIEDEKVRDNA